MSGHMPNSKDESLRKRLEVAGVFVAMAALACLVVQPASGWLGVAGIATAALLVGLGHRPLRLHFPAYGAAAVLLLMSLVSLLVTPVPGVTWLRTWLLWGNLGLFYLLILWTRTRARLTWLGAGMTALGVVAAAAAPFVVDWAAQKRPLFFPVSIYAKFPSLGVESIHPNNIASILVGLMFIPLAWAVGPARTMGGPSSIHGVFRRRWPWTAAVLLMVGVLALTQSRGGYLAAGVGGVVFLLLMARRRRFLWPLVALVLALCVVLGLREWSHGMGMLTPEALNTESLVFRWHVWRYAVLLVGDFPFTGVGMGAFNDAAFALYGFDGFRQPGAHNLFLQVALDVGIPGLIALLVLMGAVLARGVRAFARLRRLEDALLWPLAAGCIAGLAALLTHGLIDIGTWGTRGGFVLWCLLGMLACVGYCAPDPAEGSTLVESVAAQ